MPEELAENSSRCEEIVQSSSGTFSLAAATKTDLHPDWAARACVFVFPSY